MSITYYITTTIPQKHYRKIWNKHYPHVLAIFAEYMFVLQDTYGLTKSNINYIQQQIIERQQAGNTILLPAPKKWSPHESPK